ncbi:MAG: UDP-N-acetylglucosamine 2-epimerase [Desulfobacterales bacterium]|nr:UDP-N-acetylglucosamine 2-epimerase [Desulfobacterales bacterium]
MIHIVLGTKAQLIKMAPIMARLQDKGIPYNFIHTGQHRATMDEMLDDFKIKRPDKVLYDGPDIVSLSKMFLWINRILWKSVTRKQEIFGEEKKGIVLVHGDTFSTLLGALMGRFAGLRVGHVESGLRSYNLFHPFPEELTRLLTFRLSHILYCPGKWAVENLATLKREKINMYANTMADTVAMTLHKNRRQDHVPGHPFALVSLHRYENIFKKERLEDLIQHLERIALKQSLLFILHPPTEKQLRRFNLFERVTENINIECKQRYHHSDFLSLLEKTEFVVTDGGSLQEEATYMGIPCLLMRKTTERKEGLGENVVLSCYENEIINEFVQNYRQHRRQPIFVKHSPSDIVIESAIVYS